MNQMPATSINHHHVHREPLAAHRRSSAEEEDDLERLLLEDESPETMMMVSANHHHHSQAHRGLAHAAASSSSSGRLRRRKQLAAEGTPSTVESRTERAPLGARRENMTPAGAASDLDDSIVCVSPAAGDYESESAQLPECARQGTTDLCSPDWAEDSGSATAARGAPRAYPASARPVGSSSNSYLPKGGRGCLLLTATSGPLPDKTFLAATRRRASAAPLAEEEDESESSSSSSSSDSSSTSSDETVHQPAPARAPGFTSNHSAASTTGSGTVQAVRRAAAARRATAHDYPALEPFPELRGQNPSPTSTPCSSGCSELEASPAPRAPPAQTSSFLYGRVPTTSGSFKNHRILGAGADSGGTAARRPSCTPPAADGRRRRSSLFQVTMHGIKNLLTPEHSSSTAGNYNSKGGGATSNFFGGGAADKNQGTSPTTAAGGRSGRRHSVAVPGLSSTRKSHRLSLRGGGTGASPPTRPAAELSDAAANEAVAQLADFLEHRRRFTALANHLAAVEKLNGDEEDDDDDAGGGRAPDPLLESSELQSVCGGQAVPAPDLPLIPAPSTAKRMSTAGPGAPGLSPIRLAGSRRASANGMPMVPSPNGCSSLRALERIGALTAGEGGLGSPPARGASNNRGTATAGLAHAASLAPHGHGGAAHSPIRRASTKASVGSSSTTTQWRPSPSRPGLRANRVTSEAAGTNTKTDSCTQTRRQMPEDRTTQTDITLMDKVDRGTQTCVDDIMLERGTMTTLPLNLASTDRLSLLGNHGPPTTTDSGLTTITGSPVSPPPTFEAAVLMG